MKAQVIEKADGFVVVRYEAENGTEGIILGAVSMGKTEQVGLTMESKGWANPKEFVTIGSISIPVIEQLRTRKES